MVLDDLTSLSCFLFARLDVPKRKNRERGNDEVRAKHQDAAVKRHKSSHWKDGRLPQHDTEERRHQPSPSSRSPSTCRSRSCSNSHSDANREPWRTEGQSVDKKVWDAERTQRRPVGREGQGQKCEEHKGRHSHHNVQYTWGQDQSATPNDHSGWKQDTPCSKKVWGRHVHRRVQNNNVRQMNHQAVHMHL